MLKVILAIILAMACATVTPNHSGGNRNGGGRIVAADDSLTGGDGGHVHPH
jgi:hypothetical protein